MQVQSFGIKRLERWLTGIVATGLLGTAIATYLVVRSHPPNSDLTNQTVTVQSKDITVQIKANGIVQAVRKINLSPKDSGRIDHLYVDEGSRVKQGELIARMDNGQAQAQVNQYKAALARAKAELAQKQNGNRPEEIAKAKAEVAKNQAQVLEARSQLALANDRVQRKRLPSLQGAISRDDLDEALTDQRNARENMEQANATLAVAKHELALQLKGSRSEEITAAIAAVAGAKAQLRYYQTLLQNTLIRAPFAGTITRKFASEGDFVTPTTSASSSDGATSASIAEVSSGLEVEAKVPEANISRIKSAQQVEIYSDAYTKKRFKGRVRLVSPRAVKEDNVTSFRIKVSLQTGQDQLKSGMNVKLTFQGDTVKDALVIPLAAVITKKDGQTGVLLPEQNNKAKFHPVTLGSTSGAFVQILDGVSFGDRILITPPPNQKIPGVDTLEF